MLTVGLVGGVASGKSLVALNFKRLGAHIIDGDALGHEVLGLDTVRDQLVEHWGSEILAEDGALNRGFIAKVVFAEGEAGVRELAYLESVTHPEIERKIAERISLAKANGRYELVVLDAAVLLKAGWDRHCDRIIHVDVPRELRAKRAALRGMSAEQFEGREAAQMDVDEKRKRADLVIDNAGPPQKTFRQVEEVWHSLLEIA